MLLTILHQFVEMNTNRFGIVPILMMYLTIIYTWATCSCFYNVLNMLVIFLGGNSLYGSIDLTNYNLQFVHIKTINKFNIQLWICFLAAIKSEEK